MQEVKISIIIPHYQDLSNLSRCLDLLECQTIDRSALEIIIADNMSPIGLDSIRTVINGRAMLVVSTVKGAAHTRNVGVEAATGQILVFMDSDCRPDPGYLEAGIEALKSYDMVGGKIRVDVARPGHPTAAEAYELVYAFRNKLYIQKKRYTVTASLFVSRQIFDRVGPFRSHVSEDKEWCLRAYGLGYRLGYADRAVIGHPARHNWVELKRKWLRLIKESFSLYQTERFGMVKWIVYNWVVLAATFPQSLNILRSRNVPTVKEKALAFGVLLRLRIMRFIWSHEVIFNERSKGNS